MGVLDLEWVIEQAIKQRDRIKWIKKGLKRNGAEERRPLKQTCLEVSSIAPLQICRNQDWNLEIPTV